MTKYKKNGCKIKITLIESTLHLAITPQHGQMCQRTNAENFSSTKSVVRMSADCFI